MGHFSFAWGGGFSLYSTLGGRSGKFRSARRFGSLRVALFSASMELGWSAPGLVFFRYGFKSALRAWADHRIHMDGRGRLSFDHFHRKRVDPPYVLADLVDGFLGGHLSFLFGDQHWSMVGPSRV